MLNEAIKDEGDILITRFGWVQRGPRFKQMWRFNYAEREQVTWHCGAGYPEARVEEKGFRRIKQRRKEKPRDKKFIRQQEKAKDP